MSPAATVCVSTYNRAERLERLLRSLASQDFSDFEVVVYDDASSDSTRAVLASWEDRLPLTVLGGETNSGPAAGRNAAWRVARAPLVLFTDDDCVPEPGWVRAHVEAAGPVTVGRTVPAPDQVGGPFSRTLSVESADLFHTCNTGYPRDLLGRLGGFDERFRHAAGEDTELGLRALEAGASAVFLPDAIVRHDVRPSSVRAALREATKWVDLPLVVARHPDAARRLTHSRLWWRKTHPVAALAAVGLLVATRRPIASVAVVPWLRLRTSGDLAVQARRRQWPWVLPAQLAVDLVEVGTLARGAVRHRKLLL
ncbi:MAG: glycosyltransferase family 2 protein [Mycobacteriales bacterium]